MKQTKLVLTAALIVALLSGCVIIKDSPAPGCIKRIGLPMMGGCFGKTAILDLTVAAPACLAISVNNCNGGVLEVQNNCSEKLVLGSAEIPPGESVTLDAVADESGEYTLQEGYSNFTEYAPDTDASVEFTGQLGEQEIRIAFTKTAALCE